MKTTIDKKVEVEIRHLYKALLEKWNNHDAQGFAELFTPMANVIGFDGSQMNGRQQIRDGLTAIFQEHKVATYVAIVEEIRPLSGEACILRAQVGMLPPGQQKVNPEVNAIQTLLLVYSGKQWQIELYQNTPAAFHGRPELVQELTQALQKVADQHLVVL